MNEVNKIIKDNFYSSNKDIINEREKMKKKTTNKMYENFRNTVSQIKNFDKSNSYKNNEKTSKKKAKNENDASIYSLDKLIKDKNDIGILLNNENKLLRKTMEIYRNELNKINSLKTISDKQKYSSILKKRVFDLPKINLLSYEKTYQKSKDPYEEDRKNMVNLRKLFPYTRLGKYLGYTQYNTYSPKGRNKKIAFITEPEIASFSNNNDNYIKTTSNTNEIVFSSATRVFNLQSRINIKRKKIEDILHVDEMPRLNNYENMVKNIFKKIKFERKLKLQKDKYFDLKKEEARVSFYDKANEKINHGFKMLDMVESKILSNSIENFKHKKNN